MSAGHIFAVINSATVTGNEFLVLMRLADYANPDTGEAFPSMATLVKRCCISEATVHRSLANLVKEGSIEKISEGGFVNGKNETARYRLRYVPESRKQTGSHFETPGVSLYTERGSHFETQTVIRERTEKPPNPLSGGNGAVSAVPKKIKLTVQSVLQDVKPDLTLQSLSFAAAWKRWVENRLALARPVTIRAFHLHMAKCAVLGERRAMGAINHSIANSWSSIYEDKETAKKNNKPDPSL